MHSGVWLSFAVLERLIDRPQHGAQQRLLLDVKGLVTLRDKAIDLASRDFDAVFAQLLKQQRLGGMAMVILIEDECA